MGSTMYCVYASTLAIVIITTNAIQIPQDVFDKLGITETTTVGEYFENPKLLKLAQKHPNSCVDYKFGDIKIQFLELGIPSIVRAYFVRSTMIV